LLTDLHDLIALVRTNISNTERLKINSLIIIDVHSKDIVDRFVKDSIVDANEFEWES
jgi:dynein heavy chain